MTAHPSPARRLTRRNVLLGAVAAGSLATIGSTAPTARADPPPFTVFGAVASWPDLTAYGVRRLPMAYQSSLITSGLPDETKVRSAIGAQADLGVSRVCLDIEAWPVDNVSDPDFAVSAGKFNQVMTWAHDEEPGLRLGWYGLLPRRDYWSPVLGNTAGWYADNARRDVIADEVDDLYPSIYTFYTDQTGWVTYANANMDQAGIYGKPGYVFLWPKYHPSAPVDIRGTYLAAAYWRLQLETVLAHHQSTGSTIQGLVIWDDSPWDASADWWAETQAFLSDHGLA